MSQPQLEGWSAALLLSAAFLEIFRACRTSPHPFRLLILPSVHLTPDHRAARILHGIMDCRIALLILLSTSNIK